MDHTTWEKGWGWGELITAQNGLSDEDTTVEADPHGSKHQIILGPFDKKTNQYIGTESMQNTFRLQFISQHFLGQNLLAV